MDPEVTNIQQQINSQITGATANPIFPPNRLQEIQDLRETTDKLIREYKQDIIDKTERLKRTMTDYRDRVQRIVDDVNRSA